MKQLYINIYGILMLSCPMLFATWENSMMRQFIITNDTIINNDYYFGPGSDPIWATLATFQVDTTDYDDSGMIMLSAPILWDGFCSEVEGVIALRIDGNLIGVSSASISHGGTDGWGIGKWRIWAPSKVAPAFGWTTLFQQNWPLTTVILTVGMHTIELLGSIVFEDKISEGHGWSLGAGASMTFLGFENSAITQLS